MVDITNKPITQRIAIAKATVLMQIDTIKRIQENTIKKGDVISCARIAGMMAAKKTADLIPMCHPIKIEGISIDIELKIQDKQGIVDIQVSCKTTDKTGIEMEAITAASTTAITIYDMCKSYDRGIKIDNIHLAYKSGGKSGDWQHRNDSI